MIRTLLARYLTRLALVLVVVGLILGGLAVWGERRAAAKVAWYDPLDDLQPEAIAPDLALLSLSGVPDSQILSLALAADEIETVRATLTFSPELNDLERVGGWMILAQYYQNAGRRDTAARAYRLVGYNTVLSADLPDLVRVKTLLAAGRQLIALHDQHNARFCLDQATLIAAYSRDLSPFHRRSLLAQVVPAYSRVGGDHNDWEVLVEAVEKRTKPQATRGTYYWRASPGSNADLVAAQDARRAAASALHQALIQDQEDAQLKQALAEALLAEDAAVARYVSGRSSSSAWETQLHWLLIKRQIAWGGFGLELVPQWETESTRADIDTSLSAAWQAWYLSYREKEQADLYALVSAYWGLYPEAPVQALIASLSQKRTSDLNNRYRGIDLTVLEAGVPPVLGWVSD